MAQAEETVGPVIEDAAHPMDAECRMAIEEKLATTAREVGPAHIGKVVVAPKSRFGHIGLMLVDVDMGENTCRVRPGFEGACATLALDGVVLYGDYVMAFEDVMPRTPHVVEEVQAPSAMLL